MSTYKFKNPNTNEWIEIVADNFRLALEQLRALVNAG